MTSAEDDPAAQSPLPEWELWACAHAALARHGDKTALFVAERIGQLAVDGDGEGVATWVEIAARIDRLQKGERPPSG